MPWKGFTPSARSCIGKKQPCRVWSSGKKPPKPETNLPGRADLFVIFKNHPAMQYQKVSFQKKGLQMFAACLLTLIFGVPSDASAQLGRAVRQVIVTQPSSWISNTATMQCYQRASSRDAWQPVFAKPVPVLLGKKGLAWGRGVFVVPQNGIPMKAEKDLRAPAGVFQLGSLFGEKPFGQCRN